MSLTKNKIDIRKAFNYFAVAGVGLSFTVGFVSQHYNSTPEFQKATLGLMCGFLALRVINGAIPKSLPWSKKNKKQSPPKPFKSGGCNDCECH
ncbi:MAG: hypothetical protein KDJ35_06845 [Alphaproteobacteria bacterium]|nr:hypothetical protein [Alphaproteobacteria bacterium]